MIHALHLIWIIPLSAWVGYAIACVMWESKKGDEHRDYGKCTGSEDQ